MNEVRLLGRIGSEVETKNINGNYLATFSLATTKKWKSKDGEQKEATQWHKVNAWGKIAETVKKYTGKGKRVLVSGEINYRQWEKEDGSKGYATDILANNILIIDFLDTKNEEHTSEIPF